MYDEDASPASQYRERLKQQRRLRDDEIMRCAARLFAREGYEASTFKLIARAAGVSLPSVVAHFLDKEALLLQICERHLDGLMAAIERADDPDQPPRDRLDAMAVALAEAIGAAPEAHRVLAMARTTLGEARRKDLRVRERWLVALAAATLEAAAPKLAQHRDLAMPATLSLLAQLDGHAAWFRGDGPMSRADYARFVVAGSLAAVRQASHAPAAAPSTTTATDGTRHAVSRAKPTRARAKSAGVLTVPVQTGS